MRLIFLNVWNGRVHDPIKDFLISHKEDTDIFCLQEAYAEMQALSTPLLNNFQLVKNYKYVRKGEDFPQATYVKNTHDIVSSATVLENVPNVGLGLHTEVKVEGKPLYLCNVHGISKPGDKMDTDTRIKQSQTILEFYEDITGPKIIGGDFNLELETESVHMFERQGYRNLIREFGIKNTRNKFAWDRYPGSKQYYSDYVFVSAEIGVESFFVPPDEVSDHQPLILDISKIS